MNTIISNNIIIRDADPKVFWWCKDNLTVTNPTYATMKRLGKEDQIRRMHIHDKMALYSERGMDIIVPFGCLRAIWGLVKDCPYETRLNSCKAMNAKDDAISQPLFPYQEEAVSEMVSAKGGILEGSCGCGKTQIGIEIAKRIGKNALWLCHTGDLLRQTVARIKMLYPRMHVGTITEGEVKMADDGITVATIQTMAMLDKSEYSDCFDTVICDECFPAGTPIMTNDGDKAIEDIKVGDLVLSYNHKTNKTEYKKVKHLFVKTSDFLNLIIVDDRILVATENHPIYTKRGYVATEDLKHGDYVLCSMRKASRESVCIGGYMEKLAEEGLYLLRQGVCQKENVGVYDAKELSPSRILKKMGTNEDGQSDVTSGNPEKNDCDERGKRNSPSSDKETWWKRTNSTLPETFERATYKDGDEDEIRISCYNEKIGGTEAYLSDVLQDRYSDSGYDDSDRSGRREPQRGEGKGEGSEEERVPVWKRVEGVQSIEQIHPEERGRSRVVYNIEVEDNNNYFANGILVHNCHHVASSPTLMKMFGKVVQAISARYKYGLSATLTRSDGMIKSAYATIGCDMNGGFAPIHTIKKDQTNTLTAEHVRVDLDTPFDYSCLNDDGTFNYANLIDYLSQNEERNKAIAENVLAQRGRHQKQLVLCQRVEQCEILDRMLREMGMKSVVLVGKVSNKNRARILGGEDGAEAIVATYSLAKEGLDMPELSCLHMAMLTCDKAATIQSVGRIERKCEGKPDPQAFDYVDANYPYCVNRYKKRASYLRRR